MDYEVYCDESSQENFSFKGPGDRYTLISGLWIQKANRDQLRAGIKKLRETHNVFGEFKWNRVSPSRLSFYWDLVEFFFDSTIEFRTLVLRSSDLDRKLHDSDDELMFYKFYYHMLLKWLRATNNYKIVLDTKTNRLSDRVKILERCLRYSCQDSQISVQALPSDEVDFIQLVDLLMGAVSYKFHKHQTSSAKMQIVEAIEHKLGRAIGRTTQGTGKFNVFLFQPQGK